MKKTIKVLFALLIALAVLAGAGIGGWYWYDNNVDRSGWVESQGVYSYKDFYGDYVTGWQELEGETYYFFPDTAAMATYWQDIDGHRYYFSGNGTLDTGFWDIGGSRYYFAPDGVMATSWQTVGGKGYYFGGDGVMVTDWQTIGDDRYYFDANGVMATGLTDLKGQHYRFEENGKLYTGWDVLEGELVYYLPEGPRAFLWQEIEGDRYYFGTDGVMETGWLELGEDRYYLGTTGAAAVGPTEIDGTTYYFSPLGIHIVLVNETHMVPEYYDPDLKTIEGNYQVDSACYSNLLKMLTACNNAGHEYLFNSAYRTVAQQEKILKTRLEAYMEENEELTWQEAYAKARETVALPGTSEHHLGLAVDLWGDGAVAWFQEHCWEYGFILRYTKGKEHITKIVDEPWHFRYVGVVTALDMKDSGLCLEEYLGAVE